MDNKIKEFCKEYKIRFEELSINGFIGSWSVDVKAGMKTDLISGRLISIPIKKIRSKRVYYQINKLNECFSFGNKINLTN